MDSGSRTGQVVVVLRGLVRQRADGCHARVGSPGSPGETVSNRAGQQPANHDHEVTPATQQTGSAIKMLIDNLLPPRFSWHCTVLFFCPSTLPPSLHILHLRTASSPLPCARLRRLRTCHDQTGALCDLGRHDRRPAGNVRNCVHLLRAQS